MGTIHTTFINRFEEIKFKARATRAVKLEDLRGGNFYTVHLLDTELGTLVSKEAQYTGSFQSMIGGPTHTFRQPTPINSRLILDDLQLEEDNYGDTWTTVFVREGTESEINSALQVQETNSLGSMSFGNYSRSQFLGGFAAGPVVLSGVAPVITPANTIHIGGGPTLWHLDQDIGQIVQTSSTPVSTTIISGSASPIQNGSDGWMSISGLKNKLKSIF